MFDFPGLQGRTLAPVLQAEFLSRPGPPISMRARICLWLLVWFGMRPSRPRGGGQVLLQSSEWNQITGPSVTSSGRRQREGGGRRDGGGGGGGGERPLCRRTESPASCPPAGGSLLRERSTASGTPLRGPRTSPSGKDSHPGGRGGGASPQGSCLAH